MRTKAKKTVKKGGFFYIITALMLAMSGCATSGQSGTVGGQSSASSVSANTAVIGGSVEESSAHIAEEEGAETDSAGTAAAADSAASGEAASSADEAGTGETASGSTGTGAMTATYYQIDTSNLVTSINDLDLDGMFTDRDLAGAWETTTASITLSGNEASMEGTGVSIAKTDIGTVITINKEGTYVFSGELSDGQIRVEAGSEDKVQIVLNNASITNDDSACILVLSADKVFVTTAQGTENSLQDTGAEYTQESSDYTVDGVIFARDDIVFNGSGSLSVTANTKHGIVGKDDLKITGGTLYVTAPAKGIVGKDSVRIAGGTITVTAGDDAIHTDNSEKAGKGFVYICGGQLVLSSGDDGIHAETALVITGGDIQIVKSYEGLEGATIDIAGGNIDITASDDGLNAAIGYEDGSGSDAGDTGGNFWGFGGGGGGGMMDAQSDAYLRITGGTLHVNAEGDGLDANGYIYIEGGEITVDGPTGSGDGAIDTGIAAYISGGTIVAVGSSGMAETFDASSAQYAILYGFQSQVPAGTEVTLTDSAGNVVMSYTTQKASQSVVFSSPDIAPGTYTVTAGNQSETITVESISTTAGSFSGMMGGGFGGGGFGGGGFGGGQTPSGQNADGQSFGGQNTDGESADGQEFDGQGPGGQAPGGGFGGGQAPGGQGFGGHGPGGSPGQKPE